MPRFEGVLIPTGPRLTSSFSPAIAYVGVLGTCEPKINVYFPSFDVFMAGGGGGGAPAQFPPLSGHLSRSSTFQKLYKTLRHRVWLILFEIIYHPYFGAVGGASTPDLAHQPRSSFLYRRLR